MFNIKNFHPIKLRKKLIKKSMNWRTADAIVIATMVIAVIALFALIFYQVRPLQLIDVKVPVATDKIAYEAGDPISGIFFGEVFYDGEMRVTRQVFCKNYQRNILTDTGEDKVFVISTPQVLEGESRAIGRLPDDIPVGRNCVIRFVNHYDIATPFGNRVENVTYYTQNFTIIDDGEEDEEEENQQEPLFEIDEGRTDRNEENPPRTNNDRPIETEPESAPENQQQQQERKQQAEPIEPPRECMIDILGIKLLCE